MLFKTIHYAYLIFILCISTLEADFMKVSNQIQTYELIQLYKLVCTISTKKKSTSMYTLNRSLAASYDIPG